MMRIYGKIAALIFLVFVVTSSAVRAQVKIFPKNPEFEVFTTADGLSSRDVSCIYQDRFGFMWVGAVDGLNRYDGYTFKVFRPQTEDSTTLSYQAISSIIEDKNANLWIGTDNGLNRYNREQGNFTRYFGNETDNTDYPSWRINKLYLDTQGNLWIGTRDGAYTYDDENDTFTKYPPFKEKSFEVRDIEELADGRMAFATERGVVLLEADSLDYSLIQHNPVEPDNLRSNNVRRIYQDAFENLWLGLNHNGIDFYNTKEQKFYHLTHTNGTNRINTELMSNSVQCIEEHQGQLLIGTTDGLDIIDPVAANQGDFTFTHVLHDQNDPASLSSENVLTVFSSGTTLWIGTRFGGLNMYSPALKKFKHYKHRLYDSLSLSDNQVSSFLEDPAGNIWISTNGGGLNYFVRETETFYPFTSQYPKKLNNTNITHVFYDHDGKMWIPTWGGGLNYADPVTKEVGYYKREQGNPNSLNSNNLFYGIEDGEGKLWFTTSASGINVHDPDTQQFIQYLPDSEQPGSISTLYARTLYLDKNKTVWVGTYFGLYEFISATGKFRAYRQDIYHPDSLGSEQINAITEDRQGRLWIGTIGGGLNFFDRENNKFIAITEKDGLSSNIINGILEDDAGNLWVSTNGGISKIVFARPDTVAVKAIINYDVSDGLQDNQFKWRAYYKSPSTGEMFFGGANGFNMFHPDSIHTNPVVPPVYFTDFLLFNKPVPIGTKGSPLKKNILLTDELVLDHGQSVFTLGFVALNYFHPEKNQYAYMLEGFDKAWNYVGNQRNATYTNLPPGNYVFRVKAANNDGVWNEEGAALHLKVLPAWWETLWFRAGIVLLLIGTAYGLFRYRTYSLKKRNKRLEEEVHQRTKALREVNLELREKNEEIQTQNEEIISQNEEINAKSEEVHAISEELRKRNEEVLYINAHLEEEVTQRTLELDKAYRELKLTHKELTQFLYRSSHDFRRPLTTIMGLKLLADQYTEEPLTQELFEKVNTTALSMDKMLQKLLMVYDINTLAEPFQPVDFPALLNQLQSELEDEIARADTVFKVCVNVTETFYSYPTLLKIILYNLVENALRFHSPLDDSHHEVLVEVTQEAAITHICVKDNGRGIRQQYIPQIFDMYFRGHSDVEGNGLGLYIVKKALEKVGGEITVESGDQEGTCFEVRLRSEQTVKA